MPAISVPDVLVLPRLHVPDVTSVEREPRVVSPAVRGVEGAGFPVHRAFAGVPMAYVNPFIMMDQIGPVVYEPHEAKGAPWHPHRGFETVSYVLDGETAHRDSNGGGGLIRDGDTQWMTAGAGILHDELPSDQVLNSGGLTHAIQLWVNLPSKLKMTPPRYQAIEKEQLTLLTSADGGALVRLIAGELGGHLGPGSTHTPITFAHVSLFPGAQITIPWFRDFSALGYVLIGDGYAGTARRPLREHELVVFGAGDHMAFGNSSSTEALELLVLGGRPIAEPIAHYGPFVMNTREELMQAFEDYQAGRLGTIPAEHV